MEKEGEKAVNGEGREKRSKGKRKREIAGDREMERRERVKET